MYRPLASLEKSGENKGPFHRNTINDGDSQTSLPPIFPERAGRLYTGYVLSAVLHHLLIFLNLRNRTGKETRRQTWADKRDNDFFSVKKTFHKTLPSYIASYKQIVL